MIILPDKTIARARFLMPMKARRNAAIVTKFTLTARLNDGKVVWRCVFDDRDDLDAFLWAIARGTLKYERELWDLPSPAWRPDIGEQLDYIYAVTSFLTSPTGSNQTYNVPSDWNSSNNSIETIGAGGGGGGGASAYGGGGGGGAYSKITNLSLTPGGTATYQIGTGGAASTAGGDTWFNGTTLGGSSVGAKGGGLGGTANPSPSGGTGGASGSGVGTTKNSGGDGSSTTSKGGGGGGAAGPNGNGTSASANSANGGSGDTGSGGAGGTGGASPTAGGNGTEFDATHGSGGGGGGQTSNTTGANGGNYGGGGGGGQNGAGGAGIAGLIVIIYTPGGGVFPTNSPMLGM